MQLISTSPVHRATRLPFDRNLPRVTDNARLRMLIAIVPGRFLWSKASGWTR